MNVTLVVCVVVLILVISAVFLLVQHKFKHIGRFGGYVPPAPAPILPPRDKKTLSNLLIHTLATPKDFDVSIMDNAIEYYIMLIDSHEVIPKDAIFEYFNKHINAIYNNDLTYIKRMIPSIQEKVFSIPKQSIVIAEIDHLYFKWIKLNLILTKYNIPSFIASDVFILYDIHDEHNELVDKYYAQLFKLYESSHEINAMLELYKDYNNFINSVLSKLNHFNSQNPIIQKFIGDINANHEKIKHINVINKYIKHYLDLMNSVDQNNEPYDKLLMLLNDSKLSKIYNWLNKQPADTHTNFLTNNITNIIIQPSIDLYTVGIHLLNNEIQNLINTKDNSVEYNENIARHLQIVENLTDQMVQILATVSQFKGSDTVVLMDQARTTTETILAEFNTSERLQTFNQQSSDSTNNLVTEIGNQKKLLQTLFVSIGKYNNTSQHLTQLNHDQINHDIEEFSAIVAFNVKNIQLNVNNIHKKYLIAMKYADSVNASVRAIVDSQLADGEVQGRNRLPRYRYDGLRPVAGSPGVFGLWRPGESAPDLAVAAAEAANAAEAKSAARAALTAVDSPAATAGGISAGARARALIIVFKSGPRAGAGLTRQAVGAALVAMRVVRALGAFERAPGSGAAAWIFRRAGVQLELVSSVGN